MAIACTILTCAIGGVGVCSTFAAHELIAMMLLDIQDFHDRHPRA